MASIRAGFLQVRTAEGLQTVLSGTVERNDGLGLQVLGLGRKI